MVTNHHEQSQAAMVRSHIMLYQLINPDHHEPSLTTTGRGHDPSTRQLPSVKLLSLQVRQEAAHLRQNHGLAAPDLGGAQGSFPGKEPWLPYKVAYNYGDKP